MLAACAVPVIDPGQAGNDATSCVRRAHKMERGEHGLAERLLDYPNGAISTQPPSSFVR